MITFLAWFTVIGLPIAAILLIIHFLRKLTIKNSYEKYRPVWTKPMWQSTETKTPKPIYPEVTSIDEQSFMENGKVDVDCHKIVDPGTRVWRIYRSVDGVRWAECDPALTERAAANYADYIKRSNPEEFVRCNDPNGVMLFYE